MSHNLITLGPIEKSRHIEEFFIEISVQWLTIAQRIPTISTNKLSKNSIAISSSRDLRATRSSSWCLHRPIHKNHPRWILCWLKPRQSLRCKWINSVRDIQVDKMQMLGFQLYAAISQAKCNLERLLQRNLIGKINHHNIWKLQRNQLFTRRQDVYFWEW